MKASPGFTLTAKTMLLLDGVGALLSVVFLGSIAFFFSGLGMPMPTVYALAGIALIFCIHSLSCYYVAGKKQRTCLWGIAVANALYSILTAGLVVYFYYQLHPLGIVYFVLEIAVLWVLVYFEVTTLLRTH